MNKVAIVTDSTTAIPDSIAREHNLTVVPLFLAWDGESYLDGIDVTPVEFYERLVKSETMPTTSQPSVGMFAEAFKKLIDQGYDILTIVISTKLSGTYLSAIQAAADFPKNRIAVVDSLQASMPLSLVVLMTAQAAQRGATLLECTNLAKDLCQRVRTLFIVDTLEYLHKGGRVGGAARLIGTALKMKPILEIKDGEIDSFDKVRTFKKATERVFEVAEAELGKQGTIEYLGVVTANVPRVGDEFVSMAHQRFHIRNEFVGLISPIIGAHVGPGAVGFVYISAKIA
jgi:DegV family protein with EDD domain